MDLTKIPYGPSLWPAFWSDGPNWPAGGEIDVIEGVNDFSVNQATLHTSDGCVLTTPMKGTGAVVGTDCNAALDGNAGCGVTSDNDASAGAAFDKNGGGVYAMGWDAEGISVWFFPRADIPEDLASGAPEPSGWSEPMAFWAASGCDMSEFFAAQTIILDITIW